MSDESAGWRTHHSSLITRQYSLEEKGVLKGIDHVGIIVDNLDQAVALFQDVLGLPVVRRTENEARGIKAVFLKIGDAEIEFIEPTRPDVREARLGAGPARMEHLAVRVDDINKAIATLEAQGIEMLDRPTRGSTGLTAFTRPETTDGIALQLYEKDR